MIFLNKYYIRNIIRFIYILLEKQNEIIDTQYIKVILIRIHKYN